MKKFFFVVLCVGVVLGGAWLLKRFSTPATPQFHPSDHQKVILKIGEKQLTVEAVTTDQSITQGLSGRESIGSDGMLFVLAKPQRPSFWMKEMQFPLDFIWIDKDRVVDLTTNVPAPLTGQDLAELPLYRPKKPVLYVLEVPAKSVEAWQVQLNDPVSLLPFL